MTKAARAAMRWVYQKLKQDYEWRNADEQVEESIESNGYTFTEEGERFGD